MSSAVLHVSHSQGENTHTHTYTHSHTHTAATTSFCLCVCGCSWLVAPLYTLFTPHCLVHLKTSLWRKMHKYLCFIEEINDVRNLIKSPQGSWKSFLLTWHRQSCFETAAAKRNQRVCCSACSFIRTGHYRFKKRRRRKNRPFWCKSCENVFSTKEIIDLERTGSRLSEHKRFGSGWYIKKNIRIS